MKIWTNLILCILLFMTFLNAQTPNKIKKSEEDIREDMIKISRQLGVTCTECHTTKNFRLTDKTAYKVSLVHLKMVDVLRQNGLSGKNGESEASCYTCHRGQLHFDHKEKFDDHFRADQKKKQPSAKPQVVDDTEDEEKPEPKK